MKKITLMAASAAVVLASCVGNPDGKKADTVDAVEVTSDEIGGTVYTVDVAQSQVLWLGRKVTGQHTGTVDMKSGSVVVDNGAVVGGEFVLDLTTLGSTDLEGENKEKLDAHLKSDDFFDVENHPEASFQITEVKEGENELLVVSGNLTIRGTTKNITFDASVEEVTETSVRAKANFNILREDWGVNFSGKPDDLISKEINFDVTIVANNAN